MDPFQLSYPITLAVRRAAQCSVHNKFKLGAVVYTHKARIISWGWNKPHKTHPRSNHAWQTIHAELDAILGVPQELLEGATICVGRLTKSGLWATSRPCGYCQILLKEVRIRSMIYVNSAREFQQEEMICQ